MSSSPHSLHPELGATPVPCLLLCLRPPRGRQPTWKAPRVTKYCLWLRDLHFAKVTLPQPSLQRDFFSFLLCLSAEWQLGNCTLCHPLWNWVARIFLRFDFFFLFSHSVSFSKIHPFIFSFLFFIPLILLSFCLRRTSKKPNNPLPISAKRPFLETTKTNNFYLQKKIVHKIISLPPSHHTLPFPSRIEYSCIAKKIEGRDTFS